MLIPSRHNPLSPFLTLAKSFKGTITQSTLNVHPNKYFGKDTHKSFHRTSSKEWSFQQDDDDDATFIMCKIEGMED